MTGTEHGGPWGGWIPGCDCYPCAVARLEASVPAVRELRQEAEVRRLAGESPEGGR